PLRRAPLEVPYGNLAPRIPDSTDGQETLRSALMGAQPETPEGADHEPSGTRFSPTSEPGSLPLRGRPTSFSRNAAGRGETGARGSRGCGEMSRRKPGRLEFPSTLVPVGGRAVDREQEARAVILFRECVFDPRLRRPFPSGADPPPARTHLRD